MPAATATLRADDHILRDARAGPSAAPRRSFDPEEIEHLLWGAGDHRAPTPHHHRPLHQLRMREQEHHDLIRGAIPFGVEAELREPLVLANELRRRGIE